MKKKNPKPAARSRQSNAASGSPMDVGLLEQLIKLMSVNDLNTVEVRDGEKRVLLKRGAPEGVYAAPMMAAPQYAPAPAAQGSPPPSLPAATVADETAGMIQIKSPMVGTFYTAASPEAKPFVAVGSSVDEETDVCIIEAMKVFNNIKAECSGTIAKVLVTNGQTVEFGQVLFLVKP